MTHTHTHTQGHRCISCSCSPVSCVLHENNRDDSGNTVEKGAITMNDKLLIWAQADREFAQVLLFVKVCVRICVQNLFALGQYDKSYPCDKCFVSHTLNAPNTVNKTLNHNLHPSVRFHSLSFLSNFSCLRKIFFFLFQICFSVFLSFPSRVMMPVHFGWPLVKSI